MIGIYKITNPKGRIYIGQSINIESRIARYKRLQCCNSQPKLYNSFLKYTTDNHKFEILCECTIDELDSLEEYYICAYNCLKSKSGLNCNDVKNPKYPNKPIVSDETKVKMRAAKLGKKASLETRKKLSDFWLNYYAINGKQKPFSPEVIERIRQANLGRRNFNRKPLTEETKEKIRQKLKGRKLTENEIEKISNRMKKLIVNMETGIFYFGVEEAAFSMGLTKTCLNKYLNGQRKNKTNLIRLMMQEEQPLM